MSCTRPSWRWPSWPREAQGRWGHHQLSGRLPMHPKHLKAFARAMQGYEGYSQLESTRIYLNTLPTFQIVLAGAHRHVLGNHHHARRNKPEEQRGEQGTNLTLDRRCSAEAELPKIPSTRACSAPRQSLG